MGGTVIHRSGQEGMYVQEGTNIYTIADLNKVWLLLDAYESDLAWLHLGQTVEFYTEAYPCDMFSGKITFIDPVLDPTARTIKVRVNVPNEDGRLKPEMFARATYSFAPRPLHLLFSRASSWPGPAASFSYGSTLSHGFST
jgi:Cu(I)/Ag(I) efflux system membrane fusion protein